MILGEGPHLRDHAIRVLSPNTHRLRSSGLALAISTTGHKDFLAEAAQRAEAGRLRGPPWLRSSTAASLAKKSTLIHHLADQVDSNAPVEDMVKPLGLNLQHSMGRAVLRTAIQNQPPAVLWRFAEENTTWALPLAHDAKLARNLLDRLLAESVQRSRKLSHPITIRILEGLRKRYGGWPESAVQEQRWGRHDDRTQYTVHRYVVGKRLETFFAELHGDPDRLAYWRRWVSHIDDARIYKQINAFAMHIGDFVFVEFGKVGNAGYIYTPQDWGEFSPSSARSARDVKDTYVAIDRIFHRAGWQDPTDLQIFGLTRLRPSPARTS
jgi:hypothetical protein